MPLQNARLELNEAQSQFEVHIENNTAFIEFIKKGNKIWLTHTEVPTVLEGRGIGSALVEKVLHYIKEHNLVLIPSCSFVASYVNQHDQWHSILSDGYQM